MTEQLIQEIVGANIARLRKSRTPYSQVELGARVSGRLGVSPWSSATVSAAENGKREFTAAEITALALELGVLPGSLLLVPDEVESIVLGGKRDREGDIVGGTTVPRDSIQPPGDSVDPDAATARVREIATLALQLQSKLNEASEDADDLHSLAMQLRVQQLRYTQASPTQVVGAEREEDNE